MEDGYKIMMEYKGEEIHIVELSYGFFTTYENILKNSKKLDPWGGFIVKRFTKDGKPLIDYASVRSEVFRTKNVIKFTKQFNPELLI